MSGSSTSPMGPGEKEEPLWRRTQLRLQRMETWSARHRLIESGSCERIQLQDQRIAMAHRHLILLIKEWEERQGGARTG